MGEECDSPSQPTRASNCGGRLAVVVREARAAAVATPSCVRGETTGLGGASLPGYGAAHGLNLGEWKGSGSVSVLGARAESLLSESACESARLLTSKRKENQQVWAGFGGWRY